MWSLAQNALSFFKEKLPNREPVLFFNHSLERQAGASFFSPPRKHVSASGSPLPNKESVRTGTFSFFRLVGAGHVCIAS